MAISETTGLVEINGTKSDENGFGCMKLIEFLTKYGVTDWDEWHYRHNQASRGECHYSDRCPIYSKTANKYLSLTREYGSVNAPVTMKPLNLKRRANLLYRLRKHGITADTKQRVIFIPYGESPWKFPQVGRLSREFYFNIQYIIT